MSEIYFTLVFIKTQQNLLLGFKKHGFGKSTWNGYGGKLEANENAFNCAIRELHEESNLKVNQEDLNYLGVVVYHDVDSNEPKRIVHIFTASKFSGDLEETDEMRPKWFDFEDIPYENMWPDSKYWLPLVLKDLYLYASFTYKNNCDIVVHEVKKLEGPSLMVGNAHNYSCGHEGSSHDQSCEQSLTIHVQNN